MLGRVCCIRLWSWPRTLLYRLDVEPRVRYRLLRYGRNGPAHLGAGDQGEQPRHQEQEAPATINAAASRASLSQTENSGGNQRT